MTSPRSLQTAKQYSDLYKVRRSIHYLGRRPILSDSDTIDLIKTAVRESPSAFNMQSSRIVILLGDDHDRYWSTIAIPLVKEAVGEGGHISQKPQHMELFRRAHGTVLFYEDQDLVKGFEQKVPSHADLFQQWSTHGSAMAQINTWTFLELAGYGANLQHYGKMTQQAAAKAFGIPSTWLLHAEMVFGSPEGGPREKTYIDDAQRFVIHGKSAAAEKDSQA